VTAVFADVVGSTPLQERIDVESAHHVMGRFYATMRQALQANGGHVAELRGDAVVGLFGFPTVREDDALRAVRAAAAMRDALGVLNGELDRDWGVRIGMRIGVNTGEVVISSEGLAVGDAMNTAARLEQAAPSGEVLMGESTWRQVRQAVFAERIEPLCLKGKRAPVAAFRLLDAPAAAHARVRIEAPLIGRDGELGRLLAGFEHTVTTGACGLVSVIGSPGLGKTRLAQELDAKLGERATVVWGRCEPIGEGITFAPVVQVLRGAAGIGEADPEPQARAKLTALVPDDPDAGLLVERAAGILGLAAPAVAAETFWAVRRLLCALAGLGPLVVVLDDVHWGQPTFWELIEHLAEWGRHAPILLLVLARPELRELRPALAKPGGLAHDLIELTPLGAEHSRRLVDELLDRAEVPETLAARILDTTEGNPLFVGETVRMLIDDGVLRRHAEGWAIVGDAAEISVPPTISALLAARIERLDPAQRAVVEPAAVIGKQFYRGAVAQLVPPPVAAGIDEHLAALHRKEVVEPENTVWIDEPVFRFHHVLIRDAAYRSLLKEARAQLHERFADWLQMKVGELVGEHEEIIAFHLEQAHDYRRQLGPLDQHGQGLAARAAGRLRSAGQRALAREDLPAATNLLGRAARLLNADAAELSDVLIDLVEALLSAGDTTEAATVLERLRAIAGSDKRRSAWAAVFGAQLAELTDTARLHEALDELTAAADALGSARDERGVAKAHHVRAHALALLGRVGEVETVLDQALGAARRAGDIRRVNAVLTGAPRAALWGPSPVIRASGRCLNILRMSQGNRHVEALALRCQAVLEAMRGRTDAARQILDRSRGTLEELGLSVELVETEQYAGIVELIAADNRAAEYHLRAAYDGFASRNLGVGAASAAARLARALFDQHRDTEAEELTRFSEAHAGEHLQPTITWCGVRAEVLARRGSFTEAERLARHGVELASATDALIDHAEARMALAHVLREADHEPEAIEQARQASRLYQAKGHTLGAARASEFAGKRGAQRADAAQPAHDVAVCSPDDEAGMRTRLEQLEPDAGWGPATRSVHRYVGFINARDIDGIRASYAEDFRLVDHRLASPLSGGLSADEHVAAYQAMFALASDARFRVEHLGELDGVWVGKLTWIGQQNETGGEFEIPFRSIVIWKDKCSWSELFDADNERGALRAMTRLLAPSAAEVASVATGIVLCLAEALVDRDWDRLEGCFAPDLETVDHRRVTMLGLDRPGVEGFVERVRGLLALAAEARPTVEPLAELDGVAMALIVWSGHLNEGGGPFVRCWRGVFVARDDVIVRYELFDEDDEVGMLAALAGLRAARSAAAGEIGGRLR
jgi:class 3 adenylate cyclase/ketosteroid isomerase-like protein